MVDGKFQIIFISSDEIASFMPKKNPTMKSQAIKMVRTKFHICAVDISQTKVSILLFNQSAEANKYFVADFCRAYFEKSGAHFAGIQLNSIDMISTNKLELIICLIQLRWAELTQNRITQQNILEHIVALHIKRSILREQMRNKHYFNQYK